jgi:hypothetical protein
MHFSVETVNLKEFQTKYERRGKDVGKWKINVSEQHTHIEQRRNEDKRLIFVMNTNFIYS